MGLVCPDCAQTTCITTRPHLKSTHLSPQRRLPSPPSFPHVANQPAGFGHYLPTLVFSGANKLERSKTHNTHRRPSFAEIQLPYHLGARGGGQRPNVVREYRVRGQHVVHPGGKDFIGGGFTDVQHVPQVLDLFSRAVSHGDKGRGGRESGTHWYDPHLLGIYGYVVCLPLLQPYYGWRRFSKRQSRVLRAFTGVYNSA